MVMLVGGMATRYTGRAAAMMLGAPTTLSHLMFAHTCGSCIMPPMYMNSSSYLQPSQGDARAYNSSWPAETTRSPVANEAEPNSKWPCATLKHANLPRRVPPSAIPTVFLHWFAEQGLCLC